MLMRLALGPKDVEVEEVEIYDAHVFEALALVEVTGSGEVSRISRATHTVYAD